MEKNAKPALKWDKANSTYYWHIYLDRMNTSNNPNVEYLVGYSKVEYQSEAADKEALLKRKIFTLFNYGYFKRIKKICFYARIESMVNKHTDPCILILYPSHYDIPEMNHDVVYKKWGQFLHDFYDRINANKSMEGILPRSTKGGNADDFLKVENYNFKDVAQLYAHSTRCLRHGHPQDRVEDFIRRYKSMKNW